MFEKEDTVKPGFNKEACHSFFKKTSTRNEKPKIWISSLDEKLNEPTSKEITGQDKVK